MIPSRVFMYWDQGFDSAPRVVRLAVASWRTFNPDLELVLLDSKNLHQWINDDEVAPYRSVGLAKFSDQLRMALIVKHGGFWADATLFCSQPLREWGHPVAGGPVFFRTQPGKNRLLQTFFLGGEKDSLFFKIWRQEFARLLLCGAKPMTNATLNRWRRRRPSLWRNSVTTSLWSVAWVIKRTGFPYLLPHYLANRLVLTSPSFRREFLRSKPLVAGEALHFQDHPSGLQIIRKGLAEGKPPAWKLSTRTEYAPEFWEAALQEFEAFLGRE